MPPSMLQTTIVRPEWVAVQDPAHWLSDMELMTLSAWHSPTRRTEWLAGRLAVKKLLQESLGIAPRTCTVGRDGPAPHILGLERTDLVFSLSHSAGLGAATFSEKQTGGSAGLDVQHIRPVHPGLCARVFSPTEQAQITARFGVADDITGMLLFWALKEAAIKARRQGWGRTLQSIEVRLIENSAATIDMPGERPLAAQFELLNGWWLARAVLPLERLPRPQ